MKNVEQSYQKRMIAKAVKLQRKIARRMKQLTRQGQFFFTPVREGR